MRGMLRIASARAPFLRAGLAWPTNAPVELHITQLDGERLLRLIRDPVLTIMISDEAGKFAPLPPIDPDATPADLQRAIDNFADDAPAPEVVPASDADLIRQQLADEQQVGLALTYDLGIARDDIAAKATRITDLETELAAAQADGALLTKRIAELSSQAQDVITQHQATLDQLEAANVQIADLEQKLAAATKSAPAAKGKPKPAE